LEIYHNPVNIFAVLSAILKTAMLIELSGARIAPSHYEIDSIKPKHLESFSHSHSGDLLPRTMPQEILLLDCFVAPQYSRIE
jgi:hypothetical protein